MTMHARPKHHVPLYGAPICIMRSFTNKRVNANVLNTVLSFRRMMHMSRPSVQPTHIYQVCMASALMLPVQQVLHDDW